MSCLKLQIIKFVAEREVKDENEEEDEEVKKSSSSKYSLSLRISGDASRRYVSTFFFKGSVFLNRTPA